jgi:hypothetical protein
VGSLWGIAALAFCCVDAREEALRTCLDLSPGMEEAAYAELHPLLQCCRAERQGVRSAVESPCGMASQQVRTVSGLVADADAVPNGLPVQY